VAVTLRRDEALALERAATAGWLSPHGASGLAAKPRHGGA
jgi:hypothetical protein